MFRTIFTTLTALLKSSLCGTQLCIRSDTASYQLYSDSDDNDSGYTYLWWWWWMMMKQWWGCLIVTSSNQWAGIRQISLFHSGLEYLPACCALVSLTSEQAIHESLVSRNWTSTHVSFWTRTSAIFAVLRQMFHENSTKQRCRVKKSRHEEPFQKMSIVQVSKNLVLSS